MSTKIIVEKSMGRFRRVLSAFWVGLALCWTAMAVAEPTENLFSAAFRGDVPAVQALLVKGADVNAKLRDGETALIIASQKGHIEVVRALLDKGAEVNATKNDGTTALIIASREGDLNVVQALLAKGADVNAKLRGGETALFMASQVGSLNAVQALLTKGAEVNAKTSAGLTALAVAKDVKIKGILLRAGAVAAPAAPPGYWGEFKNGVLVWKSKVSPPGTEKLDIKGIGTCQPPPETGIKGVSLRPCLYLKGREEVLILLDALPPSVALQGRVYFTKLR